VLQNTEEGFFKHLVSILFLRFYLFDSTSRGIGRQRKREREK